MTQEIILTNFGNLKAYPFKMTKTTNSFEAKDFFGNIYNTPKCQDNFF